MDPTYLAILLVIALVRLVFYMVVCFKRDRRGAPPHDQLEYELERLRRRYRAGVITVEELEHAAWVAITRHDRMIDLRENPYADCPMCLGSGERFAAPCEHCLKTGKVLRKGAAGAYSQYVVTSMVERDVEHSITSRSKAMGEEGMRALERIDAQSEAIRRRFSQREIEERARRSSRSAGR